MTDPKYALPDERIQEIVAETLAEAEAADAAARQERLTGLRCTCCDDPLPADWLGAECASCAEIEV